MPVNVPPRPIPQLPMQMRGYVQQVDANDYHGFIRDEGNCWHPVDVLISPTGDGQIVVHLHDQWAWAGCPDAPRSQNLPEDAVDQIHVDVVSTIGGMGGLYVGMPSCIDVWDMGQWVISPQPNGQTILAMHGWRSRLRVCNPK